MSETLALEVRPCKTFSNSTFWVDFDIKEILRDGLRIDENWDAGWTPSTTPVLCSNVGCRAGGISGMWEGRWWEQGVLCAHTVSETPEPSGIIHY